MRMFWRTTAVLVSAWLGACASAKNPGGVGGADAQPDAPVVIGQHPDADPGAPDARPHIDAAPEPDAAPVPDAMPGSKTLSETTSGTIANDTSLACPSGENSYYRAFKLSDFGIANAFTVSRVDFGVEFAESNSSQAVTIKIYSYTGAYGGNNLTTADMTLLGNTTVQVPNINSINPFTGEEDGKGQTLTANVSGTVPAGGILVVEVLVPDPGSSGNSFYVGANTAGETEPGYIRAPKCSNSTPTAWAALSSKPTVHAIITATGTYN